METIKSIDYESIIGKWRQENIETAKSIRLRGKWKLVGLDIPEEYNKQNEYKIRMFNDLLFLTIKNTQAEYRYHLTNKLILLIREYIVIEYNNNPS